MTWLGFLLTLAFTLRFTRFFTKDGLTDDWRTWVTDRYGTDSKATMFVHCPWCVGWWLACAGALMSHWFAGEWWWQAFGVACGVSWLTALAQMWLDEA